MSKKAKKAKVSEKETKVKRKEETKPKKQPQPARRVDINTTIYRDLFKFLEEKVSVECFIDMHDRCFGKTDCQCECHKK
jgi:hypothetical protein